ncbi:methylated-DNA--[protein]-cysteine S-methyltransferase [Eubacterium multiforme]|uniref:Methylated-DNA--protein-cysteine methyltransferase n=1 Tax=Eubacterium multiforme TaxID=83339 RepID=A0ABT9UPP4_9FIRM|nr:methylated-DNA--[protein]-cysteine S-methyltransferase [Eubacterium multiforme]MDQ0148615.1 methylated-DNA-[protein]-cysteine S-methyltransferase [Eubacterium multiforme]
MAIFFYETKIGNIGIKEIEGKICNVYFGKGEFLKDDEIKEVPILKEASIQLNKYLNGDLKEFSLPLVVKGTDFMMKVWKALENIPYGETLSYKEIGEKIGNPKGARAIGLACNRNPIPIFIPCHRVVGSNGKLTGYRGGINLKEELLNLEKENNYKRLI